MSSISLKLSGIFRSRSLAGLATAGIDGLSSLDRGIVVVVLLLRDLVVELVVVLDVDIVVVVVATVVVVVVVVVGEW